MIQKRRTRIFTLIGLMILFSAQTWAQDKDKDKKQDKKEYESKDYKKEKDKSKDYKKDGNDDRYERQRDETREREGRQTGGILGRVILPRTGTASPRQLAGVPKGHYPPPGSCRVWYPNRPPGHQPPPTNCDNLHGARLERGAFILHGDRAYDADYDWRAEERRRPGSVGRDILDILFPNRR